VAVYKRTYRAYDGPITARWSRFWILSSYSRRTILGSKALLVFFIACLIWPLLCAAGLYLNHNATVLTALRFTGDHLFEVDNKFFIVFMGVQGWCAFLSTAFIGPNLIAPDLANNALPLYFCRPLSRAEYIVGRGAVIVSLLSYITWIPGLALFGIEASLSGATWAWTNINFAVALVVGFLLWILFLTLLALALSAWVRWKVVAGGLLLGCMFISSGFGAAINAVLRTDIGFYLNPAVMIARIWSSLMNAPFDVPIPTANACIALLLICAGLIYILQKKVRAYEVVR
jgi:ABC-2 type transport system permease protein